MGHIVRRPVPKLLSGCVHVSARFHPVWEVQASYPLGFFAGRMLVASTVKALGTSETAALLWT